MEDKKMSVADAFKIKPKKKLGEHIEAPTEKKAKSKEGAKKPGRKLSAGTPRTKHVRLSLTEEEYNKAMKAMKKKGDLQLAVFFRDVALSNM